jgi:hypothetical protein
VELAVV